LVALYAPDPRSPLVFDTHELGRQPGAMRRVQRSEPAPSDLGLGDVVGVPEAADVELDLRFESVMEGVLVSGTARAPLAGECARCLDAIDDEIVVDLQELYFYPDRVPEDQDAEAEDVLRAVVDDLVDLEPALRDGVVLALPQVPLCRDDCPGLCSECGARLADDPGHQHDTIDPRWAALDGLRTMNDKTNDKTESGSPGAGPTEES
jgi:uncharacterized protein